MVEIYRTNATDSHFIDLVAQLDVEMAERDGEDHSFYQQYNSIERNGLVALLKNNDKIIGCGAIKEMDGEAMEVKRMFVLKEFRGQGFAGLVLKELEQWAFDLGYSYCKLETGKRQPEAIALYEKKGYSRIPNYGQYAGVHNSVCFEKSLKEYKT